MRLIKTFNQFINENLSHTTYSDVIENMEAGTDLFINVPEDVRIILQHEYLGQTNIICGLILVSCDNRYEKTYKFYQDSSEEDEFWTLDDLSNKDKKSAMDFLQTHEYEEFEVTNFTPDWVWDKLNN